MGTVIISWLLIYCMSCNVASRSGQADDVAATAGGVVVRKKLVVAVM